MIKRAINVRDSPTELANLLKIGKKSGWDPNRMLSSIRFTNEERDEALKSIPEEEKILFRNYDANKATPVKELVDEINKNPEVKKR